MRNHPLMIAVSAESENHVLNYDVDGFLTPVKRRQHLPTKILRVLTQSAHLVWNVSLYSECMQLNVTMAIGIPSLLFLKMKNCHNGKWNFIIMFLKMKNCHNGNWNFIILFLKMKNCHNGNWNFIIMCFGIGISSYCFWKWNGQQFDLSLRKV